MASQRELHHLASHAKRKRSTPLNVDCATKSQAFHSLQAFAFEPPISSLPPNTICDQIRSSFQHRPARIPPAEIGLYEEGDEKADANSMIGQIIPGACDALVSVARDLVAALEDLKFAPPVTCVYNPLVYAWNLHEQYIRKHGGRRVEVLLIGMNPGPYGMAQTGVPFGDSTIVHNFHGITGQVESPVSSHPKRPIYGMQCPRSEISGQRLWGWARDRFGSPAEFFKRFWVYNYCPLVFMEASGKNRTPDKLHPTERKSLETACNDALVKTISTLQPRLVIGIGKYAANRLQRCGITGVKIGDIIHPSPANPQANKDWFKKIEAQLTELGVLFEK